MGRTCCTLGEEEEYIYIYIYIVFVKMPDGNRPLGRPRCRWEDNIKINLIEIHDVMDWIHLAQDRDRWQVLVNTVITFGFHKNVGELSSWAASGF
jgi:hypothetical protein